MKIDGIALLNPQRDMVAKSILTGSWENYSRIVWKNAVDLLPAASVVWDVGAYTGYYAMVAAKARPDVIVTAFEPHPNIFKAMRSNVAHNSLYNVNPINVALGSSIFQSTINITNGIPLPSGSSIVNTGKTIIGTLPISIVTGDSMLANSPSPKLIKIDVEEYELDVLAGMTEVLRRSRPSILIEILKDYNVIAVKEILEPLGYIIRRISENGANFSAPFSSSDRNYFCVAP